MKKAGRVMALILPCLLAFGALTWCATGQLRSTVETDYRNYGTSIARAIAVAASEQLTSLAGNPPADEMRSEIATLQGYIDYNKDLPGLCYIYIEEADGTVLHSFATELPRELEKANPTKSDDDEVRIAMDVRVPGAPCAKSKTPGLRVMDVAAPVSGGTLGTVHVGMNYEDLDARSAALLHSMLAISAVATVLVGALSFWLLRAP